jgi:hypothetical protein
MQTIGIAIQQTSKSRFNNLGDINMVTPSAVSAITMSWNSHTIGGSSNVKLANGPSLVDVTTIGLAYLARFPTIKDWSVSFDLVYDITDAGQADLVADNFTPAARTFIVNLPGSHTLTGTGYVESVNYTFDPKEVIRCSVSIKGNSLLVYA